MSDQNFKVKLGLDVGGTVTATTFSGSGASLTSIPISAISSVSLVSPSSGEALVYNGANWVDSDAASIKTGTPTLGSLTGNGTMPSMTSSNSISDNVSLLSKSVGALLTNAGVSAPTNFPASLTATIATTATMSISSGYSAITNGNTGTGVLATAGSTPARIIASNPAITLAGGSTAQLYSGGPGDSGTLTLNINGYTAAAAAKTLSTGNATSGTPDNGTFSGIFATANGNITGSFTIANNVAFPSAALVGFFETFQISAMSVTGLTPGYNKISLAHSAAGTLSVNSGTAFYYDNQTQPTPAITPLVVTAPASPTLLYPSGIPHYTSANSFTLTYQVQNISGNFYDTIPSLSVAAGGAFAAPTARSTWPTIGTGLTTPLTANDTTVYQGTTAFSLPITTGFSSSATKPAMSFVVGSLTASASAATVGALAGWTGKTILYKTGTANILDETVISNTGTSSGTGTTSGYRINLNSTSTNPTYTGSETTYTPSSTPISQYEAKNWNANIKYDATNWSSGYLPVGPDYSTHTGNQFFTFKFTAPLGIQKFSIKVGTNGSTAGVAGMWVAVPGSTLDTTASPTNGWLNANVAFSGSGTPGTGTGGNGSAGCAVGTVVPLNSTLSSATTYQMSFGQSSAVVGNSYEVYVRIQLTSGQSISSVSIGDGA
jgi:hypothetical protein